MLSAAIAKMGRRMTGHDQDRRARDLLYVNVYSKCHIPWLHLCTSLIVLATIAILIGWRLLAPEPVAPFPQNGSARTAYVSEIYDRCMKEQRALPEKANVTKPQIGTYCLCFARALSNTINSREYETTDDAIKAQLSLLDHVPVVLLQEAKGASNICLGMMLPNRRSTARERNIAEATNECLKNYFPEDTDFSAAVVRDKFCGCFAVGTVDRLANNKKIAKELASYHSGGQKLSLAADKAVTQLMNRCSQRF
jgi:hypothetical protein